jgi:hypothetical protein
MGNVFWDMRPCNGDLPTFCRDVLPPFSGYESKPCAAE